MRHVRRRDRLLQQIASCDMWKSLSLRSVARIQTGLIWIRAFEYLTASLQAILHTVIMIFQKRLLTLFQMKFLLLWKIVMVTINWEKDFVSSNSVCNPTRD